MSTVGSSGQTFLIVGASLAGAKAAETLRSEGFDGTILLIDDEASGPTSGRLVQRATHAVRTRPARHSSIVPLAELVTTR